MNNSNIAYFCRVCSSEKIGEFKINHYVFPGKNENWKSFFCFECGSVSDFRINKKDISYADGAFRNKDHYKRLNINSDDEKVLPPIDPWSVISFKRWSHIWKSLERSSKILTNKEIKMLDYGGYQGFLPYAFNQKQKINSYVADLDPTGLGMAQFLGSKIINLGESSIDENNFDLITIVHVLEHLEKPIEHILKLKSILSENGVIYAEVPNLYGLPMMNEAHKISFCEYSFVKIFKSAGFEILDYGFTKSPKESIKFDYIHHYDTENIFVVCGKIEKKFSIKLPKKEIPKDIKSFKYELKSKYARLMFKNISLTLLVPSLRNLKRSVLYFVYGLIDLITLKLFKISIVSKIFPKKK